MTQALGLIVLGMAVFYVFAFWQDRNLARQIGESGRAYEQQKQQFAKSLRSSARRNAKRSSIRT